MHVFSMLGQRGCMTLDSIRRNFWSHTIKKDAEGNVSYTTTCEDRIEQLKRAGFLKSEIVDARGRQEQIYYLDKKARLQFDKEERKTFYKKRPANNELRHALNIGDDLDAFSSKVVRFVNEHQLKSISSQQKTLGSEVLEVPDADITIEDAAGKQFSFSIEEDGAYHGKRLHQKLGQLAASNKSILWVCRSAARVKHIASLAKQYTNIVPIHFNNLKNI